MRIETDADGATHHAILEKQFHDENLKPCPFCGSTVLELTNTHTAHYWIKCECSAQIDGDGRSMDDDSKFDHRTAAYSTIERWNERVEVIS